MTTTIARTETRIYSFSPTSRATQLAQLLSTDAADLTTDDLLDLAAIIAQRKIEVDAPGHVARICDLLVAHIEPAARQAIEERDAARRLLDVERQISRTASAGVALVARQRDVALGLSESYQAQLLAERDRHQATLLQLEGAELLIEQSTDEAIELTAELASVRCKLAREAERAGAITAALGGLAVAATRRTYDQLAEDLRVDARFDDSDTIVVDPADLPELRCAP